MMGAAPDRQNLHRLNPRPSRTRLKTIMFASVQPNGTDALEGKKRVKLEKVYALVIGR